MAGKARNRWASYLASQVQRQVVGLSIRALLLHFSPYVLGFLTFAAAILQHIQPIQAFVDAALVAASGAVLFVNTKSYLLQTSAEGRLFPAALTVTNTVDPETHAPIEYGIGVELANNGPWPIAVAVTEVYVAIDGRVPRRPANHSTTTVVPPFERVVFAASPVEAAERSKAEVLDGELRVKGTYGRGGHLRYSFEKRYKLYLHTAQNGFAQNLRWYDLTGAPVLQPVTPSY